MLMGVIDDVLGLAKNASFCFLLQQMEYEKIVEMQAKHLSMIEVSSYGTQF
jgi:hypothetical protein